MVFNGGTVFTVLFVGTVVWVAVITVLLFRMMMHYNRLTSGVTKSGLKDILEKILQKQQGLEGSTEDLKEAIIRLAKDGSFHIQRVGLIRFNPFSDTGGSQSFTLALLDREENGIVMTSLYARTGNRWYIKEIRHGKGKDFELSKEEQAALKNARASHERHS